MKKKWPYFILGLTLIIAWYWVPVLWGGYSGFRVYRVVDFIDVTFPRGVIALQAHEGANLSKLEKDLKESLEERGLSAITIYGERWKVQFDPKTGETTLFYPLLEKTTPVRDAVREEVLSKLKAIQSEHDFIRRVGWDGRHIVVAYKTV